jgi:hypothetical protein
MTDEIERLRAERDACEAQYQQQVAMVLEQMQRADNLQSKIDAWAEALSALTRGPVGDRWDALCMALNAAEEALLAAATPKEAES